MGYLTSATYQVRTSVLEPNHDIEHGCAVLGVVRALLLPIEGEPVPDVNFEVIRRDAAETLHTTILVTGK